MHKLNGLDKYVIFSISVLIIFTIAEMVTSFWTGVHDTLTTAISRRSAGRFSLVR